jgi:GTP-binding protein
MSRRETVRCRGAAGVVVVVVDAGAALVVPALDAVADGAAEVPPLEPPHAARATTTTEQTMVEEIRRSMAATVCRSAWKCAGMSSSLPLRFVLSAPSVEDLPAARAELALVGRSNVGKSSLLNALAGRKALANVSKTPGRTQLLNLFELEDGATVVDCPGYGYASAPAATRKRWQAMMEGYLLERENLEMIVVLVDGEIGPTKLDVQMLEWLRANTLPHSVVATKHDKVKASQRDKRKRELAAGCDLLPSDIVWVSAAKGTGIDRLQKLARMWLAL